MEPCSKYSRLGRKRLFIAWERDSRADDTPDMDMDEVGFAWIIN